MTSSIPTERPPDLMNREEWLKRIGLGYDPFEFEAADDPASGDPRLGEYFVPFPYFDDLRQKRSTILFTARGCGKSANRIQLERECASTLKQSAPPCRLLAVRHDDFTTIQPSSGLKDHVEAILGKAVPALLEAMFFCVPKDVTRLPAPTREDLCWFVQNYSDRLIPSGIRDQLKVVGAARPRTKGRQVKLFQGVVQSVASLFEQKPVDAIEHATQTLLELFRWEFKEANAGTRLRAQPIDLLSRFANAAHALGIDAVFVTVDRIDEFEETAGAQEKQADLLRPLLANVPVRGILCFKFFLPSELLPALRDRLGPDAFREDKTHIREVDWKDEDIRRILSTRLSASSQRRLPSFESLIDEPGLSDVDSLLTTFAYHSPRDLVRLCHRILSEHTRQPTARLLLDPAEVQAAISWFSRTRARELYGDDDVALAIRIPHLPFDAAALAQALRLEGAEVEQKLESWKKKGLVRAVTATAKQPEGTSLYVIPDPRVVRVWKEEKDE